MGDWNAILDPNIDRAGWGASSLARCDSGQLDFLTEFDLVDRYQSGSPKEGDVDVDRKLALWPGPVLPGQSVSE